MNAKVASAGIGLLIAVDLTPLHVSQEWTNFISDNDAEPCSVASSKTISHQPVPSLPLCSPYEEEAPFANVGTYRAEHPLCSHHCALCTASEIKHTAHGFRCAPRLLSEWKICSNSCQTLGRGTAEEIFLHSPEDTGHH